MQSWEYKWIFNAGSLCIISLNVQLKIHIQEQSYYPMMDDEYIPVAANSKTVLELFNVSPYSQLKLSSEHILFFCPLSVTIITLALIVIVLILYACRGIVKFNSSVKAKLKGQTRATILAFTVVSFNRIATFIILDTIALVFNSPCNSSDPRVNGTCEFSGLIHNIPRALLGYDLMAMLLFIMFVIIALGFPRLLKFLGKCCRLQKHHLNPNTKSDQKNIQRLRYYFCAFAVIGFAVGCLVHSPYITMAYLSDAHYATSILVYYTVIFFIELGMFQYTFRIYFSYGSFIYKQRILTGILIFIQAVLVYSLVASLSFFYYYLPINNVVSNLPNEGIVVYQTALILLGAFITYKALFTPRKTTDIIMQQLSQQIKESEIACLKSMIKCKTVSNNTKDQQCKTVTKDQHDNIDNIYILLMRNKIVHLQEEITLMHVNNKIKCLSDGPNDPDDRTHPIKIARLKQQQCKILAYLMTEMERLKKETEQHDSEKDEGQIEPEESNKCQVDTDSLESEDVQTESDIPQIQLILAQSGEASESGTSNQEGDQSVQNQSATGITLQDASCQTDKCDQKQNTVNGYKKEEVYRLQCEILDHMLSKRAHLKDESHDHPQLKSIEHNIASLHNCISKYLEDKRKRLQTELQQQGTGVDTQVAIEYIDDEIRHLGEICDFKRKERMRVIHNSEQGHGDDSEEGRDRTHSNESEPLLSDQENLELQPVTNARNESSEDTAVTVDQV